MKDLRRWLALGALALATLTIGLDTTVLTIAVPDLAVDLHASTSQLQWFANAYTLVLAAAVLPAGALGDRFGRKRLLLGALVLFGLASLACAYAGDAGLLIVARALLGLGAAVLMPMSMAVLPVLFDRHELARATTVWVSATALGLPLGPVLGGFLLDHYWWGSVFLINVPLIALAVLAVAVLVPESRSTRPSPLDLVGTLVSSVALLALTYGVIRVGDHDFGDPVALAAFAVALLAGLGFALHQRRARHPLVDLTLFRTPAFTWGAVLASMVNFAMFGLMFAVPQYFQAVTGTDALGAGVRMLPMIGGLLVGARLGGRLAERAGARIAVGVGYLLIAGGLVAGAGTSVHSPYWQVAVWVGVLGAGLGAAMPTSINTALAVLPVDRSGAGSSLVTALRQVGGTIGVAVLGAVLNAGYRDRLDVTGLPAPVADAARDSVNSAVAVAPAGGSLADTARAAFVHGMDLMLGWSVLAAVAGVVAAVVFLPGRGAVERVGGDQEESRDGVAVG